MSQYKRIDSIDCVGMVEWPERPAYLDNASFAEVTGTCGDVWVETIRPQRVAVLDREPFDLPAPPAWMRDGACLSSSIDFVPSHGGSERFAQAKAVCASCAVADECLDYALRLTIVHGVWGGMTADERGRLGYDKPDTFVYFAQGADGRIKIGTSAAVKRRLRDLEHTYGTTITLLATEPGHFRRESELHARFGHLRSGGPKSEWFIAGPDLLAYIDALNGATEEVAA